MAALVYQKQVKMNSTLLAISFLLGYLSASIQLRAVRIPLRKRLFLLLFLILILALGSGLLFYLGGKIDAQGLYLLLIAAGNTAGVCMLLERWLQKVWWATLLSAILIGLINFYFAQKHLIDYKALAFALGIAGGFGYLVNGLIRKWWCRKQ